MNGRDSISVFIRSPVSFAFSLPLMYIAWKWVADCGLMVIIEVSATTVASLFASLVQTASRRAFVRSGLPLLVTKYFVFHEAAINVDNNGQRYSPFSNSDNKVQLSTS